MNINELREAVAWVAAVLVDMHDHAGDGELSDDDQTRFDEGTSFVTDTRGQIERLEARAAEVDAIRALADSDSDRSRPAFTPPQVPRTHDVFDVLEDRSASFTELRDAAVQVLEQRTAEVGDDVDLSNADRVIRKHLRQAQASPDDRERAVTESWARRLIGRCHPDYISGFNTYLRSPMTPLWSAEQSRAMAVGTNSQGGFLVPTHLDPTIILTNDGTANAIRPLARQETLIDGNVWNGVSSAGVTASWDAELAEVSDDSPTLANPSVTLHKMSSLLAASIEAFADTNFADQAMMLFADARARLEAAAHATGSGSAQPFGIFTALDANTNVEIATTTAATVGLPDIHSVYRQVPQRFRGRATWLLNPIWSLEIKELGTAVAATFSGDLREPTAGRILGRPVVESDDAPSTQTTTALDNVLALGDFSNFVIVDKPGSTAIEFIPHLFNTSNNLPDGRRGWYMHHRTGSDSVNDLAFRLLQDTTSA